MVQHPEDCFENGSEAAWPHRLGRSVSFVLVTNLIKLDRRKVFVAAVSETRISGGRGVGKGRGFNIFFLFLPLTSC